MKRVNLLAVAVAVLAATLVLAAGATAQDDEKVVLTIGLTQDLDSPNVTVGELVSSYELWNLQYASPTDLAADDFATTPGLAESWSSEDGKKWTYTIREGLEVVRRHSADRGGHRVHDQPLPGRGVAEPHLHRRQSHR